MFGWTELLLVLLVVLLVFGASRLPEVARSLGLSVNEFKRGLEDDSDKLEEPDSNDQEDADTGKDDGTKNESE
ncbi:MAG: twin-arginine translocase TatA/TatE family subunit [bacterium]